MARTLGRWEKRGSTVTANGDAPETAKLLVSKDIPAARSAPAQQRRARALQGCIEEASWALVRGWVWDPKTPDEPIRLELTDGETLLATTIASDNRPGLILS